MPITEHGSKISATEAEHLVYRWCTGEARGSHSAHALAAVYTSTYMTEDQLLRFADLKALDEVRLDWALALIRGYVEGNVNVPGPRAVALAALYELYARPNSDGELN